MPTRILIIFAVFFIAAAAITCNSADTAPTPDPIMSTLELQPTHTEDNSDELRLAKAQTVAADRINQATEQTRTAAATRESIERHLEAVLGATATSDVTGTPPSLAPAPTPGTGIIPIPVPRPTSVRPPAQTVAVPEAPDDPPTREHEAPTPQGNQPAPPTSPPPPTITTTPPTRIPRPTRAIPTATPVQPLPATREPFPPYVTSTPGPPPTRIPRPDPRPTPTPQPATLIDNHPLTNSMNQQTLAAIKNIPWATDGVAHGEYEPLRLIIELADRSPTSTLKLIEMPFLDTITPGDRETLQALLILAQHQQGIYAAIADQRPIFHIGPITDENAAAVVAWGSQVKQNIGNTGPPPWPHRYTLSKSEHEINGRTIHFKIARIGDHRRRTSDALAAAARTAESLMNRPLPVDAIMILFLQEDAAITDYYNAGFGIIFDGKYATNNQKDITDEELLRHDQERDDAFLKAIMQYYWNGNEPWIDFGIAQTAATYDQSGPDRFNYPCPDATSINLIQGRPHRANSQPDVKCAEATGSRFFLELESIIGKNALWNLITKLYDLRTNHNISIDLSYVRTEISFYADTLLRIADAGPRPHPAATAHATSSAIIGANARIVESWLAEAGCHRKISEPLNLSRTAKPVRLCIRYIYNPQSPKHAADLTVTEYGPDGLPYRQSALKVKTSPGEDESVASVTVGPEGDWAPGLHHITVANEDGSLALNYRFDPNI